MRYIIIFMVIFSSLSTIAYAEVRLPRMIRDSMVLQRDTKIKIWGWATAKEKVTVLFNKKKYSSVADHNGTWSVLIPEMNAGGPYTMSIKGKNEIKINDILIGDVWICSGQSNMVHQMKLHNVLYEEDIQNANNPHIRQFVVPNIANMQFPEDDLPGGYWKWANPKDVNDFSAVAYFFAKKIYEIYKVPIGLINASWGGTPIESWISEEGLKDFSSVIKTLQQNKDSVYVNAVNRKAAMTNRVNKLYEDRGLDEKWYELAYKPKNWRSINLPGYWEDQGIRDLDGVVWYRREIDIPASWVQQDVRIFLGRIVDADELYINGIKVGSTGYMYPQRRYAIQKGVLVPGKNVLVIRVSNNAGKGGFVPDKPYELIAGKDTIDLKGTWLYKVGEVHMPAATVSPVLLPHYQPAALYNTMIAPLVNYAIKGFLWYQGEANTGNAAEYTRLQSSLIADWRLRWGNNAPFLYVQLPGFMEMNYLPVEKSHWAELREAQRRSLMISNTAMVVAIDLGEWNDIHPDRKKEVGERLALAADKIAYGNIDRVHSGPLFQSAVLTGNKIVISFESIGSGLIAINEESLSEFAIAGADKKFVWANAKIEGDKVVVWNEKVEQPRYVRYAWADNPVNPNLFNKEGLPASPFRTDN